MSRILVVDQDAPSRRQTLGVLEDCGYESGSCDSGDQALAALREYPDYWQVLITEVALAGLDGVGLMQAVRYDLKLPVPVIAVTVYQPSVFDHGVVQGFQAWLCKPLSSSRLKAVLRKIAPASEEH
ncbi:MAG: response regulator [Planctomycetota bacterium]|nr:MAG: response regulator [Planctomycetota bacterium]